MTDIAGLGRRARLDAGTLGVVAVRVDSARQAAGLIRRGHGTGLTVAHRRGGHRRRRRLPDPGRHRRRDDPAARTGPLRHPAPGAPGGRPEATARRSRPQGGPGMAAAAAARLLPRPARRRVPSPPSQVRSQARRHGRRRRAASPSGLVARCPRQRWLPVTSIRPGAISSMMALTRATMTVTGAGTRRSRPSAAGRVRCPLRCAVGTAGVHSRPAQRSRGPTPGLL